MNNIGSKTNISVHPGLAINNSFLFLIFECKWKKKYILTLKIIKIHDSEKFFKSIDIECLEMNHYEKAFNLQVRLYWNSYALKTHLLFKFRPKDKIIEKVINLKEEEELEVKEEKRGKTKKNQKQENSIDVSKLINKNKKKKIEIKEKS